jgi:hypothetical protein
VNSTIQIDCKKTKLINHKSNSHYFRSLRKRRRTGNAPQINETQED